MFGSKSKQLGIEEGKWVYPYAGVQAGDHFSASVRDNFVESPYAYYGRRVMDWLVRPQKS